MTEETHEPQRPPGDAHEQSRPAVDAQLPPFKVAAIEAAEAELRPRGWVRIRQAVRKPFHLLRHKVQGRSIDSAYESLGSEEQEAIAVTAELGNEVLTVTESTPGSAGVAGQKAPEVAAAATEAKDDRSS